MRYALIYGGVVRNVVEADADWPGLQDADVAVQTNVAGPGWVWDGSTLAPPPPAAAPVPASVTRRQARQALLLAGLLDLVEPAIAAIPDATQRRLAEIEWQDSQVFERDRPILIQLATQIGLDSTDLDDLFRTAVEL
jgi:hypothetical protein